MIYVYIYISIINKLNYIWLNIIYIYIYTVYIISIHILLHSSALQRPPRPPSSWPPPPPVVKKNIRNPSRSDDFPPTLWLCQNSY